jgi:hypothetical protein
VLRYYGQWLAEAWSFLQRSIADHIVAATAALIAALVVPSIARLWLSGQPLANLTSDLGLNAKITAITLGVIAALLIIRAVVKAPMRLHAEISRQRDDALRERDSALSALNPANYLTSGTIHCLREPSSGTLAQRIYRLPLTCLADQIEIRRLEVRVDPPAREPFTPPRYRSTFRPTWHWDQDERPPQVMPLPENPQLGRDQAVWVDLLTVLDYDNGDWECSLPHFEAHYMINGRLDGGDYDLTVVAYTAGAKPLQRQLRLHVDPERRILEFSG